MTTPQYPTRRSLRQRTAFTLTEMLMVIAIIGILAGILTPVLMGAYARANEFKIQNDIIGLDGGIAKFKTKHGFYPPAIGPGMAIDTTNRATAVSAMRRYLNRIAPNNSEGNGSAASLLGIWYDNVGVNLDSRSSLVFWLSGLCKNKQYPLTGGTGGALPAYDNKSVDRDILFEFSDSQLEVSGVVAIYNQAAGKDEGDSAYRYRDSKSYTATVSGTVVALAYHDGFDAAAPPNPINFQNPDSFQIVAPGLDGEATTSATPTFNIEAVDAGQLDNITNFTGGRLDKIVE